MNNKVNKRIISLLLVVSLTVSLLSGCGKETENSSVSMITEQVQEVSEQMEEEISNNEMLLSTNVEDYIGNVESFVYGALSNHLKYKYDVFPGTVVLDSGLSVFGLAYTDYSECYVNEDETENYFVAGFMPAVGEITIPEEEFQNGLLIENLDFESDKTKFILGYLSDAFSCHCVVFDQYVTYGVDENGQIFYTASAFDKSLCDESLGSLYSYDEGKYLLDVDLGEFSYLSGESLVSQIDYAALEAEINQILENQDMNFANVDIETAVSFSQEAVTSYLLSLQEETFLGYDVKLLIEEANKLDPMECYRLTSEGLMTIDLEHSKEAEVARWLVGTACVITVAVGMVSSIVTMTCPPLSAANSAVTGIAIEIFMQLVTDNAKVGDVDWSRVAVAASVGAISGFVGPYAAGISGKALGFCVDSALDGLLGGMEQAVYAWMDSKTGVEVAKSFGYGLAMGFAVSAGFKGVIGAVGKAAKKLTPVMEKVNSSAMFTRVKNQVSELAEYTSGKIKSLVKVSDNNIYKAEGLADKYINKLVETSPGDLSKESLDKLAAEGILNENGKEITKNQLRNLFKEAKDGQSIGHYIVDGDRVDIVKIHNIATIEFDKTKYITLTLENGLEDTRTKTFIKTCKLLQDGGEIPESLAEYLGSEWKTMSPTDMAKLIRKRESGWIIHELGDMKTVMLVPRKIHDTVEGGIAHMGGFNLNKYVNAHMGTFVYDLMCERFVSAGASTVSQMAN